MTAPKRPESVVVVTYTRDGRVLLLRRADRPDFWQSVTGAMQWEETDPRECAVRELIEETGLRAAPYSLDRTRCFPILPAFLHRYDSAVSHNVEYAFAVELSHARTPTLSAEHVEYRWMSFDDALDRAASWTDRAAIRDVRRRAFAREEEAVVLLHGLWMKGWCMSLLARRLRCAGFRTYCFSYSTLRTTLEENARQLHAYLQTLPHRTIHLVGHSLGGIVIRALFRYFPSQLPGRIVTLGTPHAGSSVARRLASGHFGAYLVGKPVAEIMSGVPASWSLPSREIGTIAGSRSFGVGRFVTTLDAPNDGTVTVAEASLADAHDRFVLPVTHTSLLTSRDAAEAVANFLKHGRFSPASDGEKQRSR
jgi:8-oxo-dGTP pyrophosphatase MutT (NUDIX family)